MSYNLSSAIKIGFMKYAQIIVFRKLGDFKSELTYKVSENCNIGDFVEVPFRSRTLKGVVTDIIEKLPADGNMFSGSVF